MIAGTVVIGDPVQMDNALSPRDRVMALLTRLSPTPICDDCIAERLELPSRNLANRTSRELAGSAGIERRRDICALCLGEKLVTRKR